MPVEPASSPGGTSVGSKEEEVEEKRVAPRSLCASRCLWWACHRGPFLALGSKPPAITGICLIISRLLPVGPQELWPAWQRRSSGLEGAWWCHRNGSSTS